MKIGFISGDLVEVTNERKGVSVPDYPVQGYLMRRLIERGHEIVLLTRYPNPDEPPEGVVADVGGNPMDHNIDVLFGDRLGPYGSEYELDTLRQIEQYEGPIVYNQYVPYSGWAPQFREMPHLLGHQRQWTIINRSPDPKKTYHTMAGWKESIADSTGSVRWRQWEPFLMLDYPWNNEYVTPDLVGTRQFRQGYYGRVPKRERRAASVVRWLSVGDWTSVIYGPETTTAWVSKETDSFNGGRILHRDLPQALTTFEVIVQSPIDRLQNKGNLRYWPHRIVECALAGVAQLFDPGIGIPEFSQWEVRSSAALKTWMTRLETTSSLQELVRQQQEVILPHADPSAVMDRLDEILKEAIT
jgi:hypothetical protein